MNKFVMLIFVFLGCLNLVHALSINDSVPTEINDLVINWNQYISCSDCNITYLELQGEGRLDVAYNDIDPLNYTLEQNNHADGSDDFDNTNSITGTIGNTIGYFYTVSMFMNNNQVGRTCEVEIFKNGTSIASQSQSCVSQNVHSINFDPEDYSEFFYEGDTFRVDFSYSGGGGSEIINKVGTDTFSGSLFSYTSQKVGNIDGADLRFTEYLNGFNSTLDGSGNKNYTIYASNATNTINTTGSVLISPYQFVYFEDQDTNPITNFTIDNENFVDYFQFPLYDYALGENTFTFNKSGFAETTFTLNTNSSSKINTTFTMPASQINITIYDRQTEQLITQDVTLELIATVGANTTTNTGNAVFSSLDFVNEQYKVKLTAENYTTEELVFVFNNQEVVNLQAYLLPSDATNKALISFVVRDTGLNYLEGVICSALEWKPTLSSFITVSQSSTNVNGKCNLNIVLEDEVYEFKFVNGSVTKLTESERIFFDGETRNIELDLDAARADLFADVFEIDLRKTLTNNNNSVRINFHGTNTLGDSNQFCIKRYKVNSRSSSTLLNSTCVTSSSVDIEETYSINTTFDTRIVGTVTFEGFEDEIGSFRFKGRQYIEEYLKDYDILKFIPMFIFLLGLGIALTKSIEVGVVISLIATWLTVAAFPSLISGGIATGVTVILLTILWGVYQRRFN